MNRSTFNRDNADKGLEIKPIGPHQYAIYRWGEYYNWRSTVREAIKVAEAIRDNTQAPADTTIGD